MSAQDASALIAGADLIYVSDYFSFVGADARGRVAFAIDNNRGRDSDAFPAEHLYIVLHDERRGWVDLVGQGRYENTTRELLPLPDSPAFQFVGQPTTGITIASAVNDLTLRIDPIIERVRRDDAKTIFAMGSAAATLIWQNRTIPGRVIYEYLVQRNSNLMTRRTAKGLPQFQGLYLLADGADDCYVQAVSMGSHAGAFPAMGDRLGFIVRDEQAEEMYEIKFAVTKHALARGLYRWPTAWRVTSQGSAGPATLTCELVRGSRSATGSSSVSRWAWLTVH